MSKVFLFKSKPGKMRREEAPPEKEEPTRKQTKNMLIYAKAIFKKGCALTDKPQNKQLIC